MKLRPLLAWRLEDGAALDPRIVPLLRAIRARASLAAAVRSVGLSYRAAWSLIGRGAETLGAPLVVLERGRGAHLAPLGDRLLAADDAGNRALAPLGQLAIPRADRRRIPTAPLTIAASHDLALAALSERWRQSLPLDLVVKGSLESLASFARSEVAAAGFHFAPDARPEDLVAYHRWLNPRRDRLVRFIERTQGLIVAAGNPKRLRSSASLARRDVRFVNRQRGSGTRLLVDQLLDRAGIVPAAVRGYTTEEFTHLAVAATVAAGRADAGFGVEAAAAQFGLGFVPIVHEVYWFAVRASTMDRGLVARFIERLRGADVKRIAQALPGYNALGSGQIATVEEAFGASATRRQS
jgi:molybdate transport repressor ModE-like protein